MFNFRKGRGSGSESSDYGRHEQQGRGGPAQRERHGSGSEDWGQEWGEDWRGESSSGGAWHQQDTPAGQRRGGWGEQGYGAADIGGRGHPYSGAYGGYQPSAQDSGYQEHEQWSQRSQRGQSGGRAMHWDEGMARDRGQRGGQPAYGGGDFGGPHSGGQSYSGGQRVYPDDRGSRPGHGGTSGPMRGPVGPKGYRRPDERVREDLCERLATNPYVDVSDVSVEVSNGVVMLEGTVMARREKYVIEEIAEAVFGVTEVENRLRVQRNEGTERAGPVAGHLEGADTSPDRTLNKS